MTSEKKERDLTKMPIGRALIFLALPIIFANLLQITYQFTDAFWIGRLPSEDSFAAVTLGGNIIFLAFAFGSGFSVAGSILVAQYFGAGNKKKVNHIAAQSMTAIILTSIVLSVLGYFLTPQILHLMQAEEHLYNEALSFVRISFIALTFNFTSFMFQAIIRGIGEVKLPIIITLIGVIINFIIDPIFIFGYGFFPSLGVKGAALATLFTQIIASAIGFYVLFKGNYGIKTKLKDYIPDFKILKENFKLGFPSSIEIVARNLSFTILTGIVATTGLSLGIQSIVISAYGAGGNIIQLAIIISIGLSMAMSVLIGQNAGAGHVKRVKKINKIGSLISFFLILFIGIIIFIFAPYFVGFFAKDKIEVIQIGSEMLRIGSLFFGFTGLQMALTGTLRAIGNTRTPMFITIIGTWAVKIPCAYLLSKYTVLGLKGIWWSEPIAIVVITILVLIVIAKVDWNHINITKEPEIIE